MQPRPRPSTYPCFRLLPSQGARTAAARLFWTPHARRACRWARRRRVPSSVRNAAHIGARDDEPDARRAPGYRSRRAPGHLGQNRVACLRRRGLRRMCVCVRVCACAHAVCVPCRCARTLAGYCERDRVPARFGGNPRRGVSSKPIESWCTRIVPRAANRLRRFAGKVTRRYSTKN